jgi:hypothetical protein
MTKRSNKGVAVGDGRGEGIKVAVGVVVGVAAAVAGDVRDGGGRGEGRPVAVMIKVGAGRAVAAAVGRVVIGVGRRPLLANWQATRMQPNQKNNAKFSRFFIFLPPD